VATTQHNALPLLLPSSASTLPVLCEFNSLSTLKGGRNNNLKINKIPLMTAKNNENLFSDASYVSAVVFAALDAADCCCCFFFWRAKNGWKDERGKEQLLPLSGIAGSAVLSDAL
jgi:hypothetical protein